MNSTPRSSDRSDPTCSPIAGSTVRREAEQVPTPRARDRQALLAPRPAKGRVHEAVAYRRCIARLAHGGDRGTGSRPLYPAPGPAPSGSERSERRRQPGRVRTAAGITLTAASPTFTGSGTVTVGTQTFTIGTDAFATIQAAIDAVDPGGTVWVLRHLPRGRGRPVPVQRRRPLPVRHLRRDGQAEPHDHGRDRLGRPDHHLLRCPTMVDTQARKTFGPVGSSSRATTAPSPASASA